MLYLYINAFPFRSLGVIAIGNENTLTWLIILSLMLTWQQQEKVRAPLVLFCVRLPVLFDLLFMFLCVMLVLA